MNTNAMPGFDEFMKNPEMMNNAMDMLKNNPELMKKYMNMSNNTKKNDSIENLKNTDYKFDETVCITGLSNDTYNNKNGNIRGYNTDTDRYEIFITELNKTIAIKNTAFNLVNSESADPEVNISENNSAINEEISDSE